MPAVKVPRGLLFLAFTWCYAILLARAEVSLTSLRAENSLVLTGISSRPLFSWTINSLQHELRQISYQILVSGPHIGDGDVWNSGVVISNSTKLVEYTGPQLSSNARYTWTVNVSTSAGSGAAYSTFVTGPSITNGSDYNPHVSKRNKPQISDLKHQFQKSSWIWTSDGNSSTAPPGDRAFRYRYNALPKDTVQSILVLLCVNNQFTFYVNGHSIGTNKDSASWKQASQYNIELASSVNQIVFAINATNNGEPNDRANPGGVLIAMQFISTTGKLIAHNSGEDWRSTLTVPDGFQSPSLDDASWSPATIIAKYGQGPWGKNFDFQDAPLQITLPNDPPGSIASSPPQSSTIPSRLTTVSPTVTVTVSSDGPNATPNLGTTRTGTGQNINVIIGGVFGCIVLILIVLVLCLWYRQKTRKHTYFGKLPSPDLEYTDRDSNVGALRGAPSSAPSLRRFLSISVTPSMSVSAVAERNHRNREIKNHENDNADAEARMALKVLGQLASTRVTRP